MSNPKRTALHEGRTVDPSENLSQKAMFDLQDHTLRLGSGKPLDEFPTVLRIDTKDGEHGWRIKLTADGLEITKTSVDSSVITITPHVSNQITIK